MLFIQLDNAAECSLTSDTLIFVTLYLVITFRVCDSRPVISVKGNTSTLDWPKYSNEAMKPYVSQEKPQDRGLITFLLSDLFTRKHSIFPCNFKMHLFTEPIQVHKYISLGRYLLGWSSKFFVLFRLKPSRFLLHEQQQSKQRHDTKVQHHPHLLAIACCINTSHLEL